MRQHIHIYDHFSPLPVVIGLCAWLTNSWQLVHCRLYVIFLNIPASIPPVRYYQWPLRLGLAGS